MAQQYRKKTTVEAIRYTGDNADEIIAFSEHKVWEDPDGDGMWVHTPSGVVSIPVGFWVCKQLDDDVWPVEPDLFERTYEPVGG